MVLTSDEDLRSRARATELVGMVAMSVGRKGMEAILPPFIDAAILVIALLFCIFELKISFCGRKSSQLQNFRDLDWNSVSCENILMDSSAT